MSCCLYLHQDQPEVPMFYEILRLVNSLAGAPVDTFALTVASTDQN